MKVWSFVLLAILAAVAVGRFRAEAEVRRGELELARIDQQQAEVRREIDRARLDVEVLESATRLRELNQEHLSLRTVNAAQLVDDRAFAAVLGVPQDDAPPVVPSDVDIIGNAISMADPAIAARVMPEMAGDAE